MTDAPFETHSCRSAGYVVVAVESGNIYAADCDNGRCQTCGVRRARTRAAAITWCQRQQDRSRLITFTNCPADWQTRRQQIRDVRRRIVKSGRRCEWIWTTEAGSKSGMIHVHAIQHGDYVKQSVLQDMWGGRIVDVRAVHDAAQYISKSAGMVSNYITKGAGNGTDSLATHLGLNGGRLHHWSRQFFDGLSIRDAVAQSRGDRPTDRYVSVWRGADDDDRVRARALAAIVCRPAHHMDGSVVLS